MEASIGMPRDFSSDETNRASSSSMMLEDDDDVVFAVMVGKDNHSKASVQGRNWRI